MSGVKEFLSMIEKCGLPSSETLAFLINATRVVVVVLVCRKWALTRCCKWENTLQKVERFFSVRSVLVLFECGDGKVRVGWRESKELSGH